MGVPLIGADSRFDDGGVTATTITPASATGFGPERLTDDRPFTTYKMGVAGLSFVAKTDAGVGNTATVGYFMMIGHNIGTINTDGGGALTFIFEESADDAAYTTIFTTTAINDDFIVARAFTNVVNRFFRLTISRGAGDFTAQIGQLAWGEPVRFPFGVPVGYDPNQEQLNARFNEAQTGNILGSAVLFTERRVNINFQHQPSSFVDDATVGGFKEFWDNHGAKMKPFLYMWNATTTAATTTFEKDSVFGVVDPGTINRALVTQIATGFRDLAFQIVALKEA